MLSNILGYKVGHVEQQSITKWKWYICDHPQEGPGDINKLHEEVALMPMVLTPATLPSLYHPAPMTSLQVTNDQLTEEEKS